MSTSTKAPRVVAVAVPPRDQALAALTVQGRPLLQQARAALAAAAGILELGNWSAEAAQAQAELRRGAFLVVHDALCPLTPAWFIGELVAATLASGVAHVGTRPVTDTLKVVVDGRVGSTVDRDAWVAVTSPLVIPPTLGDVLAAFAERSESGERSALAEPSEFGDVPRLVDALRQRHSVELVQAPAVGRRIDDASGLRLLEALG